jgi:hypothetical protein
LQTVGVASDVVLVIRLLVAVAVVVAEMVPELAVGWDRS